MERRTLAFPGLVEYEDEFEEGSLAGAGTAADADHFPAATQSEKRGGNIFPEAIAKGGIVDAPVKKAASYRDFPVSSPGWVPAV